MRILIISLFLLSGFSLAAVENSRGERNRHGEGADFCSDQCNTPHYSKERFDDPDVPTQEERERMVFCAQNFDKCTAKEKKGFGYQ